jgi:dolichol kinase
MTLSFALSQDVDSLWTRAAILFILIVLLQVLMARVALQKETKRRLQHALTGHAMVQISYALPRNVAMVLLLLGAGGMFIFATFFSQEFRRVFGPLLRRQELSGAQLPGAFHFLLGTALTILLTDSMEIARYSVECLAIADPIASWIGSSIQSPKINQQTSIAGCVACFTAAWCVGFIMLTKDSYILSIGALVCTVAEGLPYGNDNLNIPILTALAVEKLS